MTKWLRFENVKRYNSWLASRRNKITLTQTLSWSSTQPLKPLSLSLPQLISESMEKPPSRLVLPSFLLVFFIYGVAPVISDGSDHRYKVGDDVPLYANKVGPFHNPRRVQFSLFRSELLISEFRSLPSSGFWFKFQFAFLNDSSLYSLARGFVIMELELWFQFRRFFFSSIGNDLVYMNVPGVFCIVSSDWIISSRFYLKERKCEVVNVVGC